MKIEQSNKDLIATLNIAIEPSDYLPKLKTELNKLKSKVSLKGFRQGKTPDHVIAKMYGESVLGDILNKSFQEALESYIVDNNIDYVCQPLLSADQEQIELIPTDKERIYSMSYDIGLVENLQINGISDQDTYTKYTIEVAEEDVATEMNAMAKQMGAYAFVDSAVEEFDKINLSAVELENGEDKKDGWQSSFEVYISSIPDEDTKQMFIGKIQGETVVAPIAKLTRMDAVKIRKEWLQVDEDDDRSIGDDFKYTIETVERHMPAELTDEKIEELYGDYDIKSVSDLEARLRENLQAKNQDAVVGKLYQDIHNRINEESSANFSDLFVKRWLKENEEMDDTKVEDVLEDFKKDLKWTIIQRDLQKKYNVTLEYKEIEDFLKHKANEFMQQFGYYDNTIFERILNKFLSDKKEVFNAQNAILNSKIFNSIDKNITKIEETITLEAFNKMMQPEQTEVETVS
jgi:trigger factor